MIEGVKVEFVGINNLPKAKIKGWLNLLKDSFSKAKEGQFLRLSISKGISITSPISAWSRVCRSHHVIPRSRTVKQPHGNYIVCLWFEKGNEKNIS